MLPRLTEVIGDACQRWGCKAIEVDVNSDSIYVLLSYRSKLKLSKLVDRLKSATSRMIQREFTCDLSRFYARGRELWEESYFVSSAEVVDVAKVDQKILAIPGSR